MHWPHSMARAIAFGDGVQGFKVNVFRLNFLTLERLNASDTLQCDSPVATARFP
jgi:hypothetical protein